MLRRRLLAALDRSMRWGVGLSLARVAPVAGPQGCPAEGPAERVVAVDEGDGGRVRGRRGRRRRARLRRAVPALLAARLERGSRCRVDPPRGRGGCGRRLCRRVRRHRQPAPAGLLPCLPGRMRAQRGAPGRSQAAAARPAGGGHSSPTGRQQPGGRSRARRGCPSRQGGAACAGPAPARRHHDGRRRGPAARRGRGRPGHLAERPPPAAPPSPRQPAATLRGAAPRRRCPARLPGLQRQAGAIRERTCRSTRRRDGGGAHGALRCLPGPAGRGPRAALGDAQGLRPRAAPLGSRDRARPAPVAPRPAGCQHHGHRLSSSAPAGSPRHRRRTGGGDHRGHGRGRGDLPHLCRPRHRGLDGLARPRRCRSRASAGTFRASGSFAGPLRPVPRSWLAGAGRIASVGRRRRPRPNGQCASSARRTRGGARRAAGGATRPGCDVGAGACSGSDAGGPRRPGGERGWHHPGWRGAGPGCAGWPAIGPERQRCPRRARPSAAPDPKRWAERPSRDRGRCPRVGIGCGGPGCRGPGCRGPGCRELSWGGPAVRERAACGGTLRLAALGGLGARALGRLRHATHPRNLVGAWDVTGPPGGRRRPGRASELPVPGQQA